MDNKPSPSPASPPSSARDPLVAAGPPMSSISPITVRETVESDGDLSPKVEIIVTFPVGGRGKEIAASHESMAAFEEGLGASLASLAAAVQTVGTLHGAALRPGAINVGAEEQFHEVIAAVAHDGATRVLGNMLVLTAPDGMRGKIEALVKSGMPLSFIAGYAKEVLKQQRMAKASAEPKK